MRPVSRTTGERALGGYQLGWLVAGAGLGFALPFVFADLLGLPRDLYYLVYGGGVLGFLVLYGRRTRWDPSRWLTRRRLIGAVLAGVVGGVILAQGVLARPATPELSGGLLAWSLLWRGVVYGAVDGLLLLAFPWLVVWRALGAEEGGLRRKIGAGLLAWIAVLSMTTVYHLGYEDFRSSKIVAPNVGSAIGAVPTIVTAHPLASPVSHVFLHVVAVLHCPESELFLPPHPGR